jgi:exopolysaccharide biosynthesis polyprenyl glycosylphosphotransferase
MSNRTPVLAQDWLRNVKKTERSHHSVALPLNLVEPAVAVQRSRGIGPTPATVFEHAPLSKLEGALKRTVDLFGATVGLVLLSPFLLVIALLIKLESSGPILFTQWRSGFNGRKFRIFKFRSMTVLEDGPVIRQATSEDPRFTPFGRMLRRTSIDELPQLFNVLRGEMSLVGPRPHALAHDTEYARIIAGYTLRYRVKPGITGWAQVNGYRGETGALDLMSERVKRDLWYIKNWSIWLDIKIIVGTLTFEVWQLRGY